MHQRRVRTAELPRLNRCFVNQKRVRRKYCEQADSSSQVKVHGLAPKTRVSGGAMQLYFQNAILFLSEPVRITNKEIKEKVNNNVATARTRVTR